MSDLPRGAPGRIVFEVEKEEEVHHGVTFETVELPPRFRGRDLLKSIFLGKRPKWEKEWLALGEARMEQDAADAAAGLPPRHHASEDDRYVNDDEEDEPVFATKRVGGIKHDIVPAIHAGRRYEPLGSSPLHQEQQAQLPPRPLPVSAGPVSPGSNSSANNPNSLTDHSRSRTNSAGSSSTRSSGNLSQASTLVRGRDNQRRSNPRHYSSTAWVMSSDSEEEIEELEEESDRDDDDSLAELGRFQRQPLRERH